MASLREVVEEVRRVLAAITVARQALALAHQLAGEAHDMWSATVHGSTDPEATHLPALASQACIGMDEQLLTLIRAEQALRRYLSILNAPGATTPPPGNPNTRQPPTPPTVQGRDGSHYPAAAAWCVRDLPRRVFEGGRGEVTVGYMKEIPERVRSGKDEWTSHVKDRMKQLGLREPENGPPISQHVEMKVAARMIEGNHRNVELTINHATCGSQYYQPSGCHQMLQRFLPKGYTLTVHGTTQTGKPFTEIYRGMNDQ